jgi:hypothetical protein
LDIAVWQNLTPLSWLSQCLVEGDKNDIDERGKQFGRGQDRDLFLALW